MASKKNPNIQVVEDAAEQVQVDPEEVAANGNGHDGAAQDSGAELTIVDDPSDDEGEDEGDEDGEDDGEEETEESSRPDATPDAVALPDAAVQAMTLAVAAGNTDFEGEATNLHEVKEFIAAAYKQEGVDVKEVRKQVSAFRQAYLNRRTVLLTRAFDEVRDEIAGVGGTESRSVNTRIADLMEATKKGLLEKGFDEVTAAEVAKIMAEAQQQVAPSKTRATKLERAKTYRETNPERVQQRLALRKAAAQLARGE